MRVPNSVVVTQYDVSTLQLKHPSQMGRKSRPNRMLVPREQFEREKSWEDTAADEPIFFNRNAFNLS